jgi:hypothetical protein
MALRRRKKRVINDADNKHKRIRRRGKNSKFQSSKGLMTGGDVFSRAKKEKKKEQAQRDKKNIPLRFFIPAGNDDEREIVLLDDQPHSFYEHHMKGPDGKWNVFEVCIKEKGHCPLCSKLGRDGYYVMMLTCIDFTEYRDRNGKTHKFSKKLLPVKSSQIGKFQRLYERNNNTFRGIKLIMRRDNEKSPSIGDDIEYDGTMKESMLKKYKDFSVPVDYDKYFSLPSEKELRDRYGSSAVPGDEDFDDDDFDDEIPF